jgi:hypothetical protein
MNKKCNHDNEFAFTGVKYPLILWGIVKLVMEEKIKNNEMFVYYENPLTDLPDIIKTFGRTLLLSFFMDTVIEKIGKNSYYTSCN